MSTFRNDFAKILAKLHSNCHVVCVKILPIINDLACGVYEKDGRHAWGRLPNVWGIRALREEQILAVKGIVSGRDSLLQALRVRKR